MNEQLYGTDALIEIQKTECTSAPAAIKPAPGEKKAR